MDELVYPRERTLGAITLVLGLLIWLALIVGTVGVALIGLGLAFLVYLFVHSTLIAHIKGNGVELSSAQFPDLYAQFSDCCERLALPQRPRVFIMNGGGALNAFATKFLRAEYVVLLSDIVDAMDRHPDGVRFYLGHELGHLRMKHLRATFLRWPALWLPLLGAAYARAREYTCDRHGRACCTAPEQAARALAVLGAGSRRWEGLDLAAYERQAEDSSGFWMSFHELTSGYPWLTKRVMRVMDPAGAVPGRHALAYLLAAFVPYAGRLGGGFGVLMLVYILALLAAVAIPAYQDAKVRGEVNAAMAGSQAARDALTSYYLANQKVPESLEAADIAEDVTGGARLSLDGETMVLTVAIPHGELIFTPGKDAEGRIVWSCAHGGGLKPSQVPAVCQEAQ